MSDRIECARCHARTQRLPPPGPIVRKIMQTRSDRGNPVISVPGQAAVDVACLSGAGGGAAGVRSGRPEQGRPRDRRGRKPPAVRHVYPAGPVVFRLHLVADGRHGDGAVSDRLCGGKDAGDGQHLCHRADLRLFRHSARISAPRAVLGHPGRDRAARSDDRAGRDHRAGISLGAVSVRRLPGVHRHQDAVRRRYRPQDRGKRPAAVPQAPAERDRPSARPCLLCPAAQ